MSVDTRTAFIAAGVVILVYLVGSVLFAAQRIRALKAAAPKEWEAHRQAKGEAAADRLDYERAFVDAHRPRAPFWRLAGFGVLAALTPGLLFIMDLLWPWIEQATRVEGLADGLTDGAIGRRVRFSPELPTQMAAYFGLLAAWIAVGAIMVRLYHERRPDRLEIALKKLRAQKGASKTTGA